jgi:phosphatidylglycerophosphate synthase
MLAAIVGGIAFAMTSQTAGLSQRSLWVAGGLLCQVRLLCNLFDGMVAVEQDQASPKGELYNEVPDRVSDAAIFIGLGYAVTGNPVVGLLAALLAVFVAYIRAMVNSIGAPHDYCGPMAKPQRMALVTVLSVYMAFAPVEWHTDFGDAKIVLWVVVAGCGVTAIRRLTRAVSFLEQKASQ